MSQFKLIGVEEHIRLFKKLPKRIGSKVMIKALKAAGKLLVKSAKKKIRPITIELRKGTRVTDKEIRTTIGMEVRKGKGGGADRYVVVGPRLKKNKNIAIISTWLEYGTLAHRIKPLLKKRSAAAEEAKSRGFGIRKQPFMRPAFQQTKGLMAAVIRKNIEVGIVKEVNKFLKK